MEEVTDSKDGRKNSVKYKAGILFLIERVVTVPPLRSHALKAARTFEYWCWFIDLRLIRFV
jgi:hypothetical protein